MKNRTSNGFTLVEIIFSIAFLSIVSVVILQLFLTSNDLSQKAQTQNLATLYAANTIEAAKATLMAETNLTQIKYYNDIWQEVTTKDRAQYTVTLSVNPDENLKRLLHLNVKVIDVKLVELVSIQTAHYVKGGM